MLNDLARRFSSAQAIAAPIQSRSWLAAVQSFLARPAFGMAALAVVILGISIPSLTQSKSTFRGARTTTEESENLSIILIQAPSGVLGTLEKSDNFESGVISSATSSQASASGPRILVDYATSTITTVNSSNEQVYAAPLPADAAALSDAIVTAASRLK